MVIALLIFALLIQNTCPKGMAGKSTVAASCSHCPQKLVLKAPSTAYQADIVQSDAALFPMYVLALPNVQPLFRPMPIEIPQPSIPNSYQNAYPDELLRPPRA